jgi:hypothetical protein
LYLLSKSVQVRLGYGLAPGRGKQKPIFIKNGLLGAVDILKIKTL